MFFSMCFRGFAWLSKFSKVFFFLFFIAFECSQGVFSERSCRLLHLGFLQGVFEGFFVAFSWCLFLRFSRFSCVFLVFFRGVSAFFHHACRGSIRGVSYIEAFFKELFFGRSISHGVFFRGVSAFFSSRLSW